jgi:hypothetical protein
MQQVIKGEMMSPMATLDAMQTMCIYVTMCMAMRHEQVKDDKGDVARDQRHAEEHMLGSLAGMYVTFAATFNQADSREKLIAACERQAIVFEHERDEYIAQLLNNIDNVK